MSGMLPQNDVISHVYWGKVIWEYNTSIRQRRGKGELQ